MISIFLIHWIYSLCMYTFRDNKQNSFIVADQGEHACVPPPPAISGNIRVDVYVHIKS